MARLFVKRLLDEVARPDVLVAVAGLKLAHVTLHLVPDDFASRQKQRDARADVFRKGEKSQLLAQLAVVPLLGLLQLPEVMLQLLFGPKRHPVNPLEHRARFVAAPVGPGHVHQLEVRRDVAGTRHVRAAAEVGKAPSSIWAALFIKRERDLGGEVVDELELVRVANLAVTRQGLLAREFKTAQREVGLDNLAHPALYLPQILRGERARHVEVVVKAVLDNRADAHFDVVT